MIDELEKRLGSVSSVTNMLEEGKLPEDILEELLGGFGLQVMERHDVSFACSCSEKRIEKALISIGPKDLQEMIDEGKPIEVGCQFCGKQYRFDTQALKRILNGRRQER